MWDRHDLDPFIVQEAKQPSAFQITARTMWSGNKKERKKRQERKKPQLQQQQQSMKPVII